MPSRTAVQSLARRLFHRSPRLRRWTLAALDAGYQVALLPFRRRQPAGSSAESAAVLRSTDEYNSAAEAYFAAFANPAYLADKPFSSPQMFPKHLFDVATLVQGLRLRPGDVVAEIGAGSCWLSHMLNRFGCRTISIDVSTTALAIGRQLFASDMRTNWRLDPAFAAYDGHTLPLADASCDRIIVNDAFHHIPNQRELLVEMHRVLSTDGVVGMSEPGRGHGTTEDSAREASTGVLENELNLEDLAALARSCGFKAANVVVATPYVHPEIPAHDLGAFMGGKGFSEYWKALCSALEQHHYILLYKGSSHATTARPAVLDARIDAPAEVRANVGEQPLVRLHITNAGNTRWLVERRVGAGWTRLGAHLYGETPPRALLDFDWCRADLPGDVAPGDRIAVDVSLPSLAAPGGYSVVFDLVVEGVTWFAERGSSSVAVSLVVV